MKRTFLIVCCLLVCGCVTPAEHVQHDRDALTKARIDCAVAGGQLRTSIHTWFAGSLMYTSVVPLVCDIP